jgi:hypothetical protein
MLLFLIPEITNNILRFVNPKNWRNMLVCNRAIEFFKNIKLYDEIKYICDDDLVSVFECCIKHNLINTLKYIDINKIIIYHQCSKNVFNQFEFELLSTSDEFVIFTTADQYSKILELLNNCKLRFVICHDCNKMVTQCYGEFYCCYDCYHSRVIKSESFDNMDELTAIDAYNYKQMTVARLLKNNEFEPEDFDDDEDFDIYAHWM